MTIQMTLQKNGDKSKITEQIDENLRRVYQEALEEEIPDRFRELLQRLQAKEAES
jgi:predicted metal-dependent hydrolase